MENEKKKRLEGILRAVQDIKSENEGLIGTSEVFEFLKKQQAIYEAPVKIANRINEKVRKIFPELTYKATPERITGIWENVTIAYDERIGTLGYNEFISKKGAKIFNEDFVEVYNNLEEVLKQTTNDFLPFFLEANLEKITSDEEFAPILINVLKRKYQSVRDKIESNLREKYDRCIEELFSELKNLDLASEISRREHIKRESFFIKRALEDTFDFTKMIERVQRDKTENRLFYRRAILSHVLSHGKLGMLHILDLLGILKKENWGIYIVSYNQIIKDLEEDLENLKKHKEGKEVPEDSEAINSYKFHVKRYEEYVAGNEKPRSIEEEIAAREIRLKTTIFIRRLLGQEKNWVEKVLRS